MHQVIQPGWESVNSILAQVYAGFNNITTQFLDWCCTALEKQGKTAWLLIWDNASWHYSKIGRTWLREHNQQVKLMRKGVRILPLFLPKQSPWLNPIELSLPRFRRVS